MRERTPLDELKLQGSPNLRRAEKREAQEATAADPTPDTRTELAQLDELIAKTLSACRRGQTVAGKPNPAFDHLHKLIRARDLLTKGKPRKKTTSDLLAEANSLLGIN